MATGGWLDTRMGAASEWSLDAADGRLAALRDRRALPSAFPAYDDAVNFTRRSSPVHSYPQIRMVPSVERHYRRTIGGQPAIGLSVRAQKTPRGQFSYVVERTAGVIDWRGGHAPLTTLHFITNV